MKRALIFWGIPLLWLIASCSEHSMKYKPQHHTVLIRQMQFIPSSLKVQKGDTVEFINEDMVAHDITEASHQAWSSSVLPSGNSWKLVVAGDANYYCRIHPVMKGSLVIRNEN